MTVVLLLLQIFVLDELSIALWIRPMLFPLIVMLLPMELRTIWAAAIGGVTPLGYVYHYGS